MRYIFSAATNLSGRDVNEIVHAVEKNYPEGSGVVMTLADILREEGKMEGRKEGKKEGIKEGIKEVALELLKKGSPVPFVAEVTHMDVAEVQKLKEERNVNCFLGIPECPCGSNVFVSRKETTKR